MHLDPDVGKFTERQQCIDIVGWLENIDRAGHKENDIPPRVISCRSGLDWRPGFIGLGSLEGGLGGGLYVE